MAAAEQPQILIADSTWDDKLDRYVDEEILGNKPEEPETDTEPETEETNEGVEAAPEEEKAEDEPEYVEITHNGKKVKMSLDDVIENASKGFDYTQKTQALAAEKQSLAEVARNLQQNYELQQQTIQQTAQLFAMDSQLANYQQVNWDAWTDQDPIEAQKGWHKFQMLKSQRDEVDRSIQQIQTQYSQQTVSQLQTKLREGAEELSREIKGWSPELAKALKTTAASNYGFSEEELDTVIDPRMVKVLHDAYRWRELQTKKPEVTKRVAEATKSIRPTGKVDDASANRERLLKQLKSGKSEKARRNIASSLLDKYV